MSRPQATPRFLFLAFLALAAFSGTQAQQTAQQTRASAPAASGADYLKAVELETFSLVNQYRATSKLPPLTWDGAIAKAARAHSKDMATGEIDFGHDGFGDRISRLRTVLIGLRGAGENVFMSDSLDQVARNAVAQWLRSPHHLENIRGNYNYSGLGVWENKEGTLYFTQIFVKIEPPAQETQAASPPDLVTPFGMLAAPKTHTAP